MTDLEVWTALGRQHRVGTAHMTRSRRGVSTTFLYDVDYLDHGRAIEPSFPLVTGAQYVHGLARSFADTAPDRWGRNLIAKAEKMKAREEGRSPRTLDDGDYLCGVSDDTRQGALRFTTKEGREFLGPASTVPTLVALPQLMRAADEAEDSDIAVKTLLDTGSTALGGARPKASLYLEDGHLAIVKFPHQSDSWDVMAWESITYDLMAVAGMTCPHHRMIKVGDSHVVVVARFDRDSHGHRFGYMSALTALEAGDGDHRDYEDIAEAIRDLCLHPARDLAELYRRVCFNVVWGNTDDHLRNHGFVDRGRGWELSPVFDVNPHPDTRQPSATSLLGADTYDDQASSLIDFGAVCGLKSGEARSLANDILAGTSSWRDRAERVEMSRREIDTMSDSREQRYRAVARAIAHDL